MSKKDSSFAPPLRRPLHLCFIGIGFIFAWNVCVTYSPSIAIVEPVEVNTLILLVRCLIYVACAITHKKATVFVRNKKIVGILAGLGTIATLVYIFVFNYLSISNIPIMLFCVSLIGLTQACLMLSWYDLYARMGFYHICIYFAGGNILASSIPFLLSFSEGQYSFAIALLPLIGTVFYFASRKEPYLSTAEAGREKTELRWSFPIRPMALMVVTAFLMGYTRYLETSSAISFSLTGHIISSVLFLAAALLIPLRFNFKMLYLITLPLCVIGLFLSRQAFLSLNIFGAICTNASLSFFFMFTIVLFCSISFRYGISVLWLVGFAEACKLLGMFIGNVAGFSVYQMDSGVINTAFFFDIFPVIMVIAFTVFLTEKDYKGTWGAIPLDIELSRSIGMTGVTEYELLLDRCARISRQYGLTRREEEVLIRLAQNKTVATIEKELTISNATTKSHCHHIYSKMEIHKKQELIDLVIKS